MLCSSETQKSCNRWSLAQFGPDQIGYTSVCDTRGLIRAGQGPAPGLEVAPQTVQVNSGEVRADALPDPPFPLSRAAAARPREFIAEMLSAYPPETTDASQLSAFITHV